ncbi:S-adenosylmethionine decarboxylase proenzyme isoform X2 [Orussus abietinus]|uniref:S-adenosylmethionine decarboxylase proenzyme isoform X2 n=1 Tax=Orussus abietinus TaxID=222816 RepID=UPI000C715A7B|nr:S-adenosylmethionine decarboxylase proenzyme isoform X2 [Orussus abietinus]
MRGRLAAIGRRNAGGAREVAPRWSARESEREDEGCAADKARGKGPASGCLVLPSVHRGTSFRGERASVPSHELHRSPRKREREREIDRYIERGKETAKRLAGARGRATPSRESTGIHTRRCERMAAPKDDGAESVQFFEGVEKLLEIWFTSADGKDRQRDLRTIPRQKWESLLKIVRCEIISFCSNDQVDAYVLSESSMFVSKRRLILKTCGTTTPLQCLEPLLHLVEQYTGFDEVEDLFYSRKNYKRPELQMPPHQAFEEEVALLDTFFPDGEAYCLGSADMDCWYLYTLNREKTSQGEREPDQTLEILMTHLDPDVMSIFTRDVCSSAAEATEKSGIEKLIPNMVIDDFLFEPCGYSMNGVSKSGNYMTIHITPEPEFSYVSFECNIPEASYEEVIRRVLETFKPGKFVVTIFANKESVAADCPRELGQKEYPDFGADYLREDVQYCRFKNYDLSCAFYSKFPS